MNEKVTEVEQSRIPHPVQWLSGLSTRELSLPCVRAHGEMRRLPMMMMMMRKGGRDARLRNVKQKPFCWIRRIYSVVLSTLWSTAEEGEDEDDGMRDTQGRVRKGRASSTFSTFIPSIQIRITTTTATAASKAN